MTHLRPAKPIRLGFFDRPRQLGKPVGTMSDDAE